ncbi:unnamed protein product [Alopecurus aequalis]
MIAYIIKHKRDDDDFVRMSVLVLNGTVLAPTSTKIIDMESYALVHDVNRISNINWNAYTLSFLMGYILFAKQGKSIRHWPKGNLGLLQYLYWEKVQPLDHPKLPPFMSLRPLMRNWSEAHADMRYAYDGDNGRGFGRGLVDIILRSSSGLKSPKKKLFLQTTKAKMEIMMTTMEELQKEILLIPEKLVERKLVERLNKAGVSYKPDARSMSGGEDDEAYENGPASVQTVPKEFWYQNSYEKHGSNENGNTIPTTAAEDVFEKTTPIGCKTTPSGCKTGAFEGQGTPTDPFTLADDFSVPASSSSVSMDYLDKSIPKKAPKDENSSFDSLKTMCRKIIESTKKEEGRFPKLKRKLSIKLQSSLEDGKAPKRVKKGLLFPKDVDMPQDSNALTENQIRAAVHYVETCNKNMQKAIKGKDHLSIKTTSGQKNGAIVRVMDEYFSRDKAYFPVNINDVHWFTVVMHIPNEEFQVLDSSFKLTQTKSIVEALRASIAVDIEEYNTVIKGNYPDVSAWPIKAYKMPKQGDSNSCGLWALQCLEHWDGEKWTAEVNQKKSTIQGD